MRETWGLNASELRVLKRLDTPERVQGFLDELAYNRDTDPHTCFSPRLVLRHGRAHCMEGALLAAAAFRLNGRPPLIVDLAAVRDDDHILAVFREGQCWGAAAKSSYTGLRFRDPVYRTLRELVMSYFPHYYNPAGEKTLRAYSRPVNLARFDALGWMASEEDVWYIPDHLTSLPHIRLLTPAQVRRLTAMDELLYEAGMAGRSLHAVSARARPTQVSRRLSRSRSAPSRLAVVR